MRLGETLARKDRRLDLEDDRAQPADVHVVGEQFQRVIEPRAGLHQQREIAGENGDVLRRRGRDSVGKRQRPAGRLLLSATVSIGTQAEIFDALRHFGADSARRSSRSRSRPFWVSAR